LVFRIEELAKVGKIVHMGNRRTRIEGDDGGSRFLQNVDACLLNYMALHPRR
jgi:hypothetical protein